MIDYNDIDDVRKKLQIIKYTNLMNKVDNNIKYKIQIILEYLNNSNNSIKSQKEISYNQLKNDITQLEENSYKKKWNSLKKFQKKNKLTKYINNTNQNEETKKILIDAFDNKEKIIVNYDENKGEIIYLKFKSIKI